MGPYGTFQLQSLDNTGYKQVLVDTVKQLDLAAGESLQADLANGSLDIGTACGLPNGAAIGVHDHDTIGIKDGNHLLADAVAVLHEYQHVQNAKALGTPFDALMAGPCGAGLHAEMTDASAGQLCELITEADNLSEDDKQSLCNLFDGLVTRCCQELCTGRLPDHAAATLMPSLN
jgi:hypothetical protein